MKIILNPHEGASAADVIALARAAHFAPSEGLATGKPGDAMAVTLGGDLRLTYGVVRQKDSVSAYPPALAEAGRTKEG